MIKAIIFDMDGVIVDSEPLNKEADKWVCEQYGIKVPASEWNNLKGKTNRDIFSYLIDNFSEGGNFNPEELSQAKKRRYLEIAPLRISLVEGSKDFIHQIRQLADKIALTTSSSKAIQEMTFNIFDLHDYFDEIVTGDEINNGKPHPESYLKTLEKLKIEPRHAVVIEDSVNGIRAAKAAGCRTIGITTSFPKDTLKNAGADYAVDKFEEIYRVILDNY